MPSASVHSLYLHVPFCAKKCSYCAFYSEAGNAALINRFVEAFCQELEIVSQDMSPKTIFFGGGTPSILNLGQWKQILGTLDRLGISGPGEWTVECNPATVSPDKARLLHDHGVNRISMGVQSFDETLLDRLGRVHSREMVFKSYQILRDAGFQNINLDLMFAIPGQTLEQWSSSLREAFKLEPEHLSCYEVIYEEDTPLFAQLKQGAFSVNETLAEEMYEVLLQLTAEHRFHQYEVANFARGSGSGDAIPEFACQHNINYWRGGSFYGLGPSAAGYVEGVRTKNVSSTERYCELLAKGERAIETREQLEPRHRAGEIAAFGLRMNAGWPWQQFQTITGFDLRQEWPEEINRLVNGGFASVTAENFSLTNRGLRFADYAAQQFL